VYEYSDDFGTGTKKRLMILSTWQQCLTMMKMMKMAALLNQSGVPHKAGEGLIQNPLLAAKREEEEGINKS
jgi:hypothetical protein